MLIKFLIAILYFQLTFADTIDVCTRDIDSQTLMGIFTQRQIDDAQTKLDSAYAWSRSSKSIVKAQTLRHAFVAWRQGSKFVSARGFGAKLRDESNPLLGIINPTVFVDEEEYLNKRDIICETVIEATQETIANNWQRVIDIYESHHTPWHAISNNCYAPAMLVWQALGNGEFPFVNDNFTIGTKTKAMCTIL